MCCNIHFHLHHNNYTNVQYLLPLGFIQKTNIFQHSRRRRTLFHLLLWKAVTSCCLQVCEGRSELVWRHRRGRLLQRHVPFKSKQPLLSFSPRVRVAREEQKKRGGGGKLLRGWRKLVLLGVGKLAPFVRRHFAPHSSTALNSPLYMSMSWRGHPLWPEIFLPRPMDCHLFPG